MESSPNQPTNQLTLDTFLVKVEPPGVLQTVLHKAYEEIKAFTEWLKENTIHYIVAEHPADDEVTTTHTHILIEGLKVSREALRKQIIKHAPGRGQNFTSAITQKKKIPYQRDELSVYIIKGQIDYVKSTSFNDIQIATWASDWINRKKLIVNDATPDTSDVAVKKKVNTIYEDCNEIVEQYLPDTTWKDMEERSNRQLIVQAIIAWANQKHKAMNAYKVADYHDCIVMKCIPEFYSTLCVNILNNRHKYKQ